MSTAFINSRMFSSYSGLPCKACRAEPRTNGVLSPSKPYFVSNSRTSISTRSIISASSGLIMSHLFKKTTIFGTPTCFARRTCSFVWGIAPSVAKQQQELNHPFEQSTSNHVFNVVSVTWTVNVCIVTFFSIIFDVWCINCYTTSFFFRCIVNCIVWFSFW